MRNPNLALLVAAAEALRPLLAELVFVGGCVTGLLITDDAADEPRGTIDVDAIAALTSYAQYAEFGERLRALGFHEDSRESAPVCRWVLREITLDVMPLDESILGFSNRWYKAAMESSTTMRLAPHLEIRLITAPYFVATKLDAFLGRGRDDLFGSRDLEDFMSVVNGRETLASEIRDEQSDLRVFVSREVNRLLTNPLFLDALPGFLLPDAASQWRIGIVLDRLRAIAALG